MTGSLVARFSRYVEPLILKEVEEATTYQQCWEIYQRYPKSHATEKAIEKFLDILEQAINKASDSSELRKIRHFALPAPGDIQGWSHDDPTPFASMIVARIDSLVEAIIIKMKVLDEEARVKALASDNFWVKMQLLTILAWPWNRQYDNKPTLELFESTFEMADDPEKCWFLYNITYDVELTKRVAEKLDALLTEQGF